MKGKSSLWFLFSVISAFSTSSVVLADIPAPGKLILGPDIKLNAYVDTYYQYNLNRPPVSTSPALAPQNNYRAYDLVHHQFQLNQVRIGISHAPSPIGFDVQVGMGTQMDRLSALSSSTTTAGVTAATTVPDMTYTPVRRATIDWASKMGCFGSIGRFDANLGIERIDSVDNWNYSRSMAFAATRPKFFNGIKYGHNFTGNWVAVVTAANGADLTTDNNRAKTFGANFGYDTQKTSFGVNYVAGSEKPSDSLKWRHTVIGYGKHQYNDHFWIGIDGTFVGGVDEVVNNVNSFRTSARRYGAAGYANYSFLTGHWDALRFEWLQDTQGAVTGLQKSVSFYNTTLTHRYLATANLSLWAEARWDHASSDAFTSASGTVGSKQDQITGTLAATFQL